MSILLADDHKLMRDGLRAILEREGLRVVGEASDGREVLPLARTLKPEIVLMDVSMPGLNGVDATRCLLAELPKIKVIGLTMNADRRYVLAMFRAGASGYILKSSASEELIQAIRTVTDHKTYVSPSIASIVVQDAIEHGAAAVQADKALSAREREVLQLLAEGKTSKEIGTALDICVSTVETHRRQITDKLALKSVAELTKYAIREGLTSVD